MPGYILHLAAARIYLDKIIDKNILKHNKKFENDFLVGNLLPDTVKDKKYSHFRNPEYQDRMIEWPHPERFRRKYAALMKNAVCCGYYYHLYVDKMFLKYYLPQVVEYYDKNGNATEIRSCVDHVLLKKSGKRVPVEEYLSEKYYYGDYTKMNTFLTERFELPEKLDPVKNPGIHEITCTDPGVIMRELVKYERFPASAVNELNVFDMETLLPFLFETADESRDSGRMG